MVRQVWKEDGYKSLLGQEVASLFGAREYGEFGRFRVSQEREDGIYFISRV